jgi:hypothetical protein
MDLLFVAAIWFIVGWISNDLWKSIKRLAQDIRDHGWRNNR